MSATEGLLLFIAWLRHLPHHPRCVRRGSSMKADLLTAAAGILLGLACAAIIQAAGREFANLLNAISEGAE